jgi:hypothetical protein
VDIGLVRTFRFRGTSEFSRELVAAVSLDNVLGEHVVYDEGTDREIQDVLPKTLRVGGSYRLHRSARRIGSTDLRPFGLVLQLEYLDVLNSRVLDAIAGGAEVSIYELVDIRFGLIGEDHSFTDCSNCKKVSWDATYGFGLRIPVGMFTDGRVPLEFRFDLARMEQPSYVRDYSDWDPFTVVSLSAAWRFSQ